MNLSKAFLVLSLAAVLAAIGCGKAEKPKAPVSEPAPAADVSGAVVEQESQAEPEEVVTAVEVEAVATPEPVMSLSENPTEAKNNGIQSIKEWSAGESLKAAALKGSIEASRRALKNGAAIDFAGSDGRTSVVIAIANGKTGTAKFLIQSGADVNRLDASDSSLLHVAAQANSPVMLRYLLALKKFNVDVNLRNKFDQTALDYALAFGKRGKMAVAILKKHGAQESANPQI